MTKELVEEAIGRPPKEQAVIKEAKEAVKRIASAKRTINEYECCKKNEQKILKRYEHRLELLKQGKYTLKAYIPYGSSNPTGYEIEYKEKDA